MNTNDEILKAVNAAALKYIDVDAIAKKLAPQIAAKIEDSVLRNMDELEWYDFTAGICQNDAIQKLMVKKLKTALGAA